MRTNNLRSESFNAGHVNAPPGLLVVLALLAFGGYGTLADEKALESKLPGKLRCQAMQTAGLHDYAGPPESYEASTFFESKFELRINKVLTRHLAETSPGVAEATPDLFLTLFPSASSQGDNSPVELRCRQIQGQSKELGYSCSNTPPSELLLINPANLRFTRASIGGWTFSDSPPKASAIKKEASAIKKEAPAGKKQASAAADQTVGGHLGNDSLFVEFGNCERP